MPNLEIKHFIIQSFTFGVRYYSSKKSAPINHRGAHKTATLKLCSHAVIMFLYIYAVLIHLSIRI